VLERIPQGGEKRKRTHFSRQRQLTPVTSRSSSRCRIESRALTGNSDPLNPSKNVLLIDLLAVDKNELGARATAENRRFDLGSPLADGRKTLWIWWDNELSEPTPRIGTSLFRG